MAGSQVPEQLAGVGYEAVPVAPGVLVEGHGHVSFALVGLAAAVGG